MDAEEAPDLLPTLVDAVLPMLKPYEFTLYLLLLRATEFKGGKGTRSSQGNYQHITEAQRPRRRWLHRRRRHVSGGNAIPRSTARGRPCRTGGDCYVGAAREGAGLFHRPGAADRADGARQVEVPTAATATLDHIVDQSLGGPNTPENLTTACLTCNAIKSGPHI
jgi:5-methylcytosine-specific restriction endonuclease McrA